MSRVEAKSSRTEVIDVASRELAYTTTSEFCSFTSSCGNLCKRKQAQASGKARKKPDKSKAK